MENPNVRSPESLFRVGELLSGFTANWALCGGWAVDAWLGRQTRDHGDVDVAVFEDDQAAILEHMAHGWNLIGHDDSVADDSEDPWEGRKLFLPAHIHARAPGQPEVEFHLNERRNDSWVLCREPVISMPFRECIRQSLWGMPAVVPEVILYYKALPPGWRGTRPDLREHDHTDSDLLRDILGEGQREWIHHAISRVDPGHSWLSKLS